MSNFDLYYWPVPFRGQFIRAILAYAGQSWDEHDADAIADLMGREFEKQPIAFMGPPVLIDRERQFAISQMSAIAVYLGERLELQPDTQQGRALTAKVANDANDVIDELTLNGGQQMWTPENWEEFKPRLQRWLHIFQDTGERNGLKADSGYMLGTDGPGISDIVTAVLWATMSERFAGIEAIVKGSSPAIWGLTQRIMAMPAIAELSERSLKLYGDEYCGGEIEKSLREVAG